MNRQSSSTTWVADPTAERISVDFFRDHGSVSKRVRKLVAQAVAAYGGIEEFCSIIDEVWAPFDPHTVKKKDAETLLNEWKEKVFSHTTSQQEVVDAEMIMWLCDTIIAVYSNAVDRNNRFHLLITCTDLIIAMSDYFDDMPELTQAVWAPVGDGWNDPSHGLSEEFSGPLLQCHIALRNAVSVLNNYLIDCLAQDSYEIFKKKEWKDELRLVQAFMHQVIGYRQMINEWSWPVIGQEHVADEHERIDGGIEALVGTWHDLGFALKREGIIKDSWSENKEKKKKKKKAKPEKIKHKEKKKKKNKKK